LLFVRAWQRKGFEVDILLLINKDWNIGEQSVCFENWKKEFGFITLFQITSGKPFTPSIRVMKWLIKNSGKYKYVVYRDEPIAWKAGFFCVKKSKNFIDYNDFLLPKTSNFQKIKYLPLHYLEKLMIKKAICMDVRHEKYFQNQNIFIPNLPLALFETDFKTAYEKQRSKLPSIIFVGSYLHYLLDLITYPGFAEIIKIPGIQIFIISRAITPEITKRFNNNAFVWLADVEDLKPFYAKAWISIVPGYKKDGPLIKFAESIVFKTPVVCSGDALLGYEFLNEQKILVPASNDMGTFVDNIQRHLSDPKKLEDISQELYQLLKKKLSFNSIVNILPS